MALDSTYGDQLTLQAGSNLYLIQLRIVSSLGASAMVHIFFSISHLLQALHLVTFRKKMGSILLALPDSKKNQKITRIEMKMR